MFHLVEAIEKSNPQVVILRKNNVFNVLQNTFFNSNSN